MDDLAPNFSLLSTKEKDALILQLLARLEALELENVALREKLNLPPKTPDNSSTPPAAGHKSNGETTHRPKGKAHAGAHRELHPKPTRHRDVPASQCQHCRADVSGVAQKPVHTYDRHGRLVVRDRRFVEVILFQKYNAIPLELAALFREKTSLAPEFGAHHLFSSSVSGAPGLTSGHGVEFLGHERYLD
jgi:hypothetical protein